MKKLVSVLFALLLIGSSAFAEVAVGAWGRYLVAPISAVSGDIETDDNMAFAGPNWGGRGRVGVNFSGTSDNVGFNLNLDSNGNAFGVGDQAKVWIKLSDMFKIEVGKVQGDVLRGKIDDSSFFGAIAGDGTLGDLPYVTPITGKNDVFKRFYPNKGLLLDITPAEGVYLGAAIDADNQPTTENMFKSVQVGAGYVIPNVGHLRAQYIGNVDDKVVDGETVDQPKYFQAAFAYTAMEGLVVDAGVKYQTVSEAGKSQFVVHATYNKDALSTTGRAGILFGKEGEDDDLGYLASADLGYKVADPMSVGSEVAYYKEGDLQSFSLLPYAKLGYASGYLKAGFEYTSVSGIDGAEYSTWAIPIIVEYGF